MRLNLVFCISLPLERTNPAASGGPGGARRHCRHLGEARSFSLRCHAGKVKKVTFGRSDFFQEKKSIWMKAKHFRLCERDLLLEDFMSKC